MTTEKCPNPNCKDGLIGVLDNGFDTPVACCICQGKGTVNVVAKLETGPATFQVDDSSEKGKKL